MSYAPNRSSNAELEEGMTDGKYKKVVQDRGGFVEGERLYDDRKDLSDVWHGIHEVEEKVFPDGSKPRRTKNYVATKPSQIDV